MTRTALEILDRNPAGCFLLVENEETDTQTHHNEPCAVAAGHHETGGLSALANDAGDPELRCVTTATPPR